MRIYIDIRAVRGTDHADVGGVLDINNAKDLGALVLRRHVVELAALEREPALLPGLAAKRGGASTHLGHPASVDKVLLGLEPHKGAVVQHTPAALGVLEYTTCDGEVAILVFLLVYTVTCQQCITSEQGQVSTHRCRPLPPQARLPQHRQHVQPPAHA